MVNEKFMKRIRGVLVDFGVKRAGIFGSYSRGEQGRGSDVDILVELGKGVSLLGLVRIKIALEEELRKKVDLVEYVSLKPEIKKSVLNEEVRIL